MYENKDKLIQQNLAFKWRWRPLFFTRNNKGMRVREVIKQASKKTMNKFRKAYNKQYNLITRKEKTK